MERVKRLRYFTLQRLCQLVALDLLEVLLLLNNVDQLVAANFGPNVMVVLHQHVLTDTLFQTPAKQQLAELLHLVLVLIELVLAVAEEERADLEALVKQELILVLQFTLYLRVNLQDVIL